MKKIQMISSWLLILSSFWVGIVLLSGCSGQSQPPATPLADSPATSTPTHQPVPLTEEATDETAAPAAAESGSPTSLPPTASATPLPPDLPSVDPVVETAQDPLLEGQALVEALQQGGYVIAFRHAVTNYSQLDLDRQDLANCDTQRNLSQAGRDQARAIGQAFQALQIPVGLVLASPYCRTLETAQLAFGQVEATRGLISPFSTENQTERDQLGAALQQLLAMPPAAETNTVLVTHMLNIQAGTQLDVAEGEAIVAEPDGAGGFAIVARVLPEVWGALVPARAGTGETAQAEATAPVAPTLQEYPVPAGSRPHDVAPAPDGTVWYTAQGSGELGRLDPVTGETHHIALGSGSAPHGVIVGPDGAAWVTDGGLNAIVRVDAVTEAVQAFPLPTDSGYANLNTATFDLNGVLWFTGQSGIYGRLDPAAGQVEVFAAPRGRGPYGITTTPEGVVYYTSLAGSHIARLDGTTATVIEPPTPDQGARRVWSDSQGRIWVSEWNAAQVAIYDPATEEWREWRLPGEQPLPYAVYVDDQDKVWLSDFAANALVRFDPEQEEFEVFPLPSPAANVRQILGRPGEVWGAESGTDKLVVVRTSL